jgi:hypothetical protein
MSKVQHSVKLVSYNSSDLDRVSYSTGDVVFDSTNTTLRVMDGVNQGGFQLLRADLSNAQGALGVTISDDPPAKPKTGSLWFNSSNGALYIYYTDSSGSQWIQPVAAPGIVTQAGTYTLPAATLYNRGGVIADGTTILVSSNGVISLSSTGSYSNSSFAGNTTFQHITYQVTSFSQTMPVGGGVIEYDWSNNTGIFLQTGVNANYTANFTNLPTTNNRVYTATVIINQSATGSYYPQAVQINGSPYTLNWNKGTAPVPGTSETDKFIFILLKSNNTWSVYADYELDRTAGAVDNSLYSLPLASTTQLGGVIADGTTISVTGGTISLSATPNTANSLLAGQTTVQHITYTLGTVLGGSGVVTYDWTSGNSVYYQTGVTANFTANFSNMPTTNNRLYVIGIAIAQGSTGYYPNAVQINGVSQTLNWNSAVTPITPGTNEKDLFTFTLLRANNAWSVSGNILTNGV